MSRYLESVSLLPLTIPVPPVPRNSGDFLGPRVGHYWIVTSASVSWTALAPGDPTIFSVDIMVNGQVAHSFPDIAGALSVAVTHDVMNLVIRARDAVQMRQTFNNFSAGAIVDTTYTLTLNGVVREP